MDTADKQGFTKFAFADGLLDCGSVQMISTRSLLARRQHTLPMKAVGSRRRQGRCRPYRD